MNDDANRDIADQAAEQLGPEASLFPELDSALLNRSLLRSLRAASANPAAVGLLALQAMVEAGWATAAMAARALGAEVEGPADREVDRRFKDPAWENNFLFYGVKQAYGILGHTFTDLVALGETDPISDEKAQMYAQLIVDAMAPTNFFLTNPTAIKRAFDTGGLSVFRGARNAMDDVLHNKGMPRQIDEDAFTVGEDLAVTPGKVVFRNDLMEILQYEPRTEAVREVPLLLSPPWINKYYIMDLSPNRSFAEWAIEHGQTVFAISYRNPGAEMRDTSLEDYLINGPRTAIDVITEITGAEKVNVAGVCLGGLMTAVLAAYLQAEGDDRIGSLTLMNTLLDYSEPGQLGAFTDEETVQRLEEKMAERGYLEGSEMRGTFDILRANDLIFNYVVNNWLLGEDPPAFDILAWNSDSTRMPADMHSFYLRSFYMENLLVHGGLELGGQPIRLENVKNDTFMVAAVNDHIVPWKGSYAGTQMLGGDVDFLLTSSGHIAGIVNPPSPKAHYFLADEYPAHPDEWAALADRHEGSWWEPWAQWISSRSGASVPPPSMGSEKHPPLDDAPGRYVHE